MVRTIFSALPLALLTLLAGCGGGSGSGSGSDGNTPPPVTSKTQATFYPASFNGVGSPAYDGGRPVEYDAETATITATCNITHGPCGGVDVTIAPTAAYRGNANRIWHYSFYPPNLDSDQAPGEMKPGTFGTAIRPIVHMPYQPGLEGVYDSGGCNVSFGAFKILELEATGTNVTRLAVDFADSCKTRDLEDATYGAIRINSTIPVDRRLPVAVAGADYAQLEIEPIELSGSQSFSTLGPISTYRWEQTAGPSGTLLTPSSANTRFVPDAPIPTGGADFTFRVTATDRNGASDSDAITIFVESRRTPVSVLHVDAGNEFVPAVPFNAYVLPSKKPTRSEFWTINASNQIPYRLLIAGNDETVELTRGFHSALRVEPAAAPLLPGQAYASSTGSYIDLGVRNRSCGFPDGAGEFLVHDITYAAPDSDVVTSAWIEFQFDCDSVGTGRRDHGFVLINHPIPDNITMIN